MAELHKEIEALLEEDNKALGVNEIARKLDRPVATVQRYLNKQGYFVKTPDRKWTFPSGLSFADYPQCEEWVLDMTKEDLDDLLSDVLNNTNKLLQAEKTYKDVAQVMSDRAAYIHEQVKVALVLNGYNELESKKDTKRSIKLPTKKSSKIDTEGRPIRTENEDNEAWKVRRVEYILQRRIAGKMINNAEEEREDFMLMSDEDIERAVMNPNHSGAY